MESIVEEAGTAVIAMIFGALVIPAFVKIIMSLAV